MSKGQLTRDAILDHGVRVASQVGLGGLTIGSLADQIGMSKSGLFAHFGGKEALQMAVLERGIEQFVDVVIRPALAQPRGEPRLRKLFENWLHWENVILPGGCLFITVTVEFDDRPGPIRETIVQNQRDWFDTVAQVYRSGVTEGQFRDDLEPEAVAFQLKGVMLAYHHASRMLRDPRAENWARKCFDGLLDVVQVSQPAAFAATPR